MKYYRYSGEIWAFALDGSQDAFIPNGAVEFTEQEVQTLLARPTESPNAKRIGELQALLAASDYKAMPDYDRPDPAILVQRQAWRDEIRSLLAA